MSFPGVAAELEGSDLILNIGPLLSDSNTGGFTRNITDKQLVLLGHNKCQVQDKKFEAMHFLPVVEKLVAKLEKDSKANNVPSDKSWNKVEARPQPNGHV